MSKARAAEVTAAAAAGKVDLLASEFHRHEVSQAADIARIESSLTDVERAHAAAEKRTADTLKEIKDGVSALHARFDRVIEDRGRRAHQS